MEKLATADSPRAVHTRFLWLFFLLVVAVGSAFGAPPDELKAHHRPDRLILKPKAGMQAQRAAALNAAHAVLGAHIHRQYPKLRGIQVVKLPPGRDLKQALEHYRNTGLFEYVVPDYEVTIAATPNDPSYLDGTLWGMHNTGQNFGTADADIDAPEAWDVRTNADAVVVAVIDTGVRYTHEDLAANMWTNPGEIPGNSIDDDGNGYIDDVYGINAITGSGDPNDDHFHGTHVSGTIGGVGNNGVGVVGVAWRVKIMALKFLNSGGSGFNSDAIECINYAVTKGAHIMSNSWGCQGCFDQALLDAIAAARAAGVIFVAAAGNNGVNIDATPFYPAGYTNDNLVSVAATDRNDLLAGFSNYGANGVDLGAPGVSIYSTWNTADNAYNTISGTSMACPHVAGALALVKAQYPSENYGKLIERVLASVDPLASLTGKCQTDGRLNLYRALTQPLDLIVSPRALFSATGPDGGAFTPASQLYILANVGSSPFNWTATKNVAWLDLSATSDTLAAGASNTVTASINATGNTLLPGTYTANITFSNLTSGIGQVRRVSLQVVDSLVVTPPNDFVSSGPPGGPFSPISQTYVLSNRAVSARSWTASKSTSWLSLSATAGSLPAGAKTNEVVSVNALADTLASGIYTDTVTFVNVATALNQTRRAVLRVGVDDLTEWFTAADNDLDNLSLTFTPNGSVNFYGVCTTPAVAFPVDPTGGTALPLTDDSFTNVTLTGGSQVSLYGTNYSSFFIGSNGYITFGSGDWTFIETDTNHFNRVRISALFDDLNPGTGGTISWKQLSDRAAVTWQDVPEFATSNTNSFQVEMFFDGRIRITYLALAATDGLAGLSRGTGVPPGFIESDLSAYSSCGPPTPPTTPQLYAPLAVATNRIDLSWSFVGDATGYIVRRDGAQIATTSGPSYFDIGLTPDSTHCYTVLATNSTGSSAESAASCATTLSIPVYGMNGAADFPGYLLSSPGMTIYAAVHGQTLYVATWSPGTNGPNDHFILVSDQLLPSASANAPWGKAGLVAVAASKPFLGGESQNDFVGWFVDGAANNLQLAAKAPMNSGQMEGTLDLITTFGYLPPTIYIAAAAYSTGDLGVLVSQAPAGNSDLNIDSNEFLALPTVTLLDRNRDGLYDRLDPKLDFIVTQVQPNTEEDGFDIVWACVPGKKYQLQYCDSLTADTWHDLGPLRTADPGQILMSHTDTTVSGTAYRFYHVKLVP